MTSYLLQQLLNGIQLGSIYALIALGYTMVYGIIKLINFAHADIFMVGAYIAFFAVAFYTGTAAGEVRELPPVIWIWLSVIVGYLLFGFIAGRLPFLAKPFLLLEESRRQADGSFLSRSGWAGAKGILNLFGIALVSAAVFPVFYYGTMLLFRIPWGVFLFPVTIVYVMVICAALGVAMERIAYRPLRYKPRLSALITALGVSLFLENFSSLGMVFGNQYRAFPEIIEKREVFRPAALDLSISNMFLINMGVLAVLLFGLWFLVEKTLIGKQMRAVAYDKKAASLMGIDVDGVISVTFIIGPALAGVSGILYATNYGILQTPFLGFFPGLKAFIAAVLGGIGSLPGAVLGALIMGVSEVFANSVDSNLGFAAAFVILIVILLIRPNGLLGKTTVEKV